MILAAVAIVVGGVVLLKKSDTTAPSGPSNHTLGKGTTGVELVQYGDFECPGCGAFFPIVKQVTDSYKDQIKFKFVHFPLTQLHLNAQSAARAAEAAGNQGKFWEMHDLLYENQQAWKTTTNASGTFQAYAQQIGLDITKFKTDYSSATTNAIINADIKTGQALKVTGTPTFFLNGKLIEDNNSISSFEKLKAVIDAEIAKKNGKPAETSTDTTTDASTTETSLPSTDGTTPENDTDTTPAAQ